MKRGVFPSLLALLALLAELRDLSRCHLIPSFLSLTPEDCISLIMWTIALLSLAVLGDVAWGKPLSTGRKGSCSFSVTL